VSGLKSGDFLEIDGTWTDEREIRASSIRVLGEAEAASCRPDAARGEASEARSARADAERRFLDGDDDVEDSRAGR
jgi:hypothetical protein